MFIQILSEVKIPTVSVYTFHLSLLLKYPAFVSVMNNIWEIF